jgi:hypothetical protein
MRKKTRKLIGTVALLTIVICYAFIAMALAEGRILAAPKALQVVAYALLGFVRSGSGVGQASALAASDPLDDLSRPAAGRARTGVEAPGALAIRTGVFARPRRSGFGLVARIEVGLVVRFLVVRRHDVLLPVAPAVPASGR